MSDSMSSASWFRGQAKDLVSEMNEISALVRKKSEEIGAPAPEDSIKLRRGLSGVGADDTDGQKELVRTALAELDPSGWGKLSHSDVELKDLSGYGGSRTFKVWAPAGSGAAPEVIALHSRGENHDDFFMRRFLACDYLGQGVRSGRGFVCLSGLLLSFSIHIAHCA